MKVLIYSDVHGNLPAFEKMLFKEGDCDEYICLGDLVNYGPWSNECVDLALSLPNSRLLMGNHEIAYLEGAYPGSNPLVQLFFYTTISKFNRINSIKSFTDSCKLAKYTCIHTINNEYIYPDTNIILNDNYIVGHSHHQFKYTYKSFTLYNSGSVGQNRKLINVANYLIYHIEQDMLEMKYLEYDVDLIINKMKSENYPQSCLDYYFNKKRL